MLRIEALEPAELTVGTLFWRRTLLIQRRPHHRRGFGLAGLQKRGIIVARLIVPEILARLAAERVARFRNRRERDHAALNLAVLDLLQHAAGDVFGMPARIHQEAFSIGLKPSTEIVYIPFPPFLPDGFGPGVLARSPVPYAS